MNYQTFRSHPDLSSLIKCFWTLEVPEDFSTEKQRIVPDGCIEMAFILGDDIRRFTSETDFVLQPRAMVLGQILEPFHIQPTGYVHTFAVRFYPLGFANFVADPIQDLANREKPLADLFGKESAEYLEMQIIQAADTNERIALVEAFLRSRLQDDRLISKIVQSTVDALLATGGSASIQSILQGDLTKRRQLERKFIKQIGISPKQLAKVIRLQTALKMMLNETSESLTQIAYESEYYDQNHFIKDFKEFTGTTPREFLEDESLLLSSLFYQEG